MRLDAGAQNGTSQAKTKRIFNISIRLYESIGVEVGPDLNNMEAIPFMRFVCLFPFVSELQSKLLRLKQRQRKLLPRSRSRASTHPFA